MARSYSAPVIIFARLRLSAKRIIDGTVIMISYNIIVLLPRIRNYCIMLSTYDNHDLFPFDGTNARCHRIRFTYRVISSWSSTALTIARRQLHNVIMIAWPKLLHAVINRPAFYTFVGNDSVINDNKEYLAYSVIFITAATPGSRIFGFK